MELKLKKLSPGKWEALEGSGEEKVPSPSISHHLPLSPTICLYLPPSASISHIPLYLPPSPSISTISLAGSGEDKVQAIHAVTRTPSPIPNPNTLGASHQCGAECRGRGGGGGKQRTQG